MIQVAYSFKLHGIKVSVTEVFLHPALRAGLKAFQTHWHNAKCTFGIYSQLILIGSFNGVIRKEQLTHHFFFVKTPTTLPRLRLECNLV